MKADRDEFIARMKHLDKDALVGITISLYAHSAVELGFADRGLGDL